MSQAPLDEPRPLLASLGREVKSAASTFFFEPASARPLAALRVGLACVLLAQAAALGSELVLWLSREGLFQGDLGRTFAPSFGPHIDDFLPFFKTIGLDEAGAIRAVGGAYVVALVFLGLGLGTRLAAALAWFSHWILMTGTEPMLYGVDTYAHVFLFYLIWVPAGRAFSLDALLARKRPLPTPGARLGLRVLQLQMAISYLVSGIQKSAFSSWWDGELIFRSLSLPDYNRFDTTWLASYPALAQLACWGTLVVELGYCVFIWPKRTRKLWIAAVCGLHLSIAVLLGLHFFGAIMCMLTLTLFGVSPDSALPPRARLAYPSAALPWKT